jgi:hypothetical protein
MDEATFERTARFEELRDKLQTLIRGLLPGFPGLVVPRAAAE